MTAAPATGETAAATVRGAGVVVTNDDGIDSPGLHELAAAAAALGHAVVVAAPAAEASGSGAAMSGAGPGARITLDRRVLPGLGGIPGYAVRSAPAFIAFAAAHQAFGGRPGLLLSGINRGPNTGLAVLHSGTVGAALTAANHGIPAAAFSLRLRAGLPLPLGHRGGGGPRGHPGARRPAPWPGPQRERARRAAGPAARHPLRAACPGGRGAGQHHRRGW